MRRKSASKRNSGLIVIDVQRAFCDSALSRGSPHTEKISKRIASIAPTFRKAGMKVYAVHSENAAGLEESKFHHFCPKKADERIAKQNDSAFKNKRFRKKLRTAGIKHLLICGFNLNACVAATALDARKKGLRVTLLNDLVGNDRHNDPQATPAVLKSLRSAGVAFSSSAAVLNTVTPWLPKLDHMTRKTTKYNPHWMRYLWR